jgi:(1->4)-alpha-D-glucan 1-alpha-D-glucosylmutase
VSEQTGSLPESPEGRPPGSAPSSTYRLQLSPDFDFADAADQAAYLADLGVTHAYLSPILQAAPGSVHGYDVIDHSRISAGLGGEDGFRYLAKRFARNRIGLVVDLVPNHMALPAPEYLNRPLWSVLSGGAEAPYAHWFDVDWDAGDGRLVLPILPRPLRHCQAGFAVTRLSELTGSAGLPDADVLADILAGGGDVPVLRYQGHVLPLRPGTQRLPMPELLAAQRYRLESWRTGASELNWRRFLDISSLIAIRVEEPDVFAATHGLLLGLVAEGLIDGLRIDHVDGLADPGGYLRQLSTAAGGSWIVTEKVLGPGEELPADWDCAGTTGYDTLAAVGEVFTDEGGIGPLSAVYERYVAGPAEFATAAYLARRLAATRLLAPELARLTRLAARLGDLAWTIEDLRAVLAELLACFTSYRAYVSPGEPAPAASVRLIGDAVAQARARLPARLRPAADQVAALLLGGRVPAEQRQLRDELIVRFQQTCSAVQAKGVEDTAEYRWTRLVSANEVGGDPGNPARTVTDFHRFAERLAASWPTGMTTLSTHDTKRQEDARARLAVLAEVPDEWGRELAIWRERLLSLAGAVRRVRAPDPPTEYLLWQTLVGAWPISDERLTGYLLKAMREAKLSTSWTNSDGSYEAAALSYARRILADPEISRRIDAFVRRIRPAAAVHSLGAKLVQLTMPGVPDVYQGCELTGLSLVDPDNRRPVDYARRHELLASVQRRLSAADLDAAADLDPASDLDTAKLLVTAAALRLRRAHPDWFAGSYERLTAAGQASEHVVAFCRGTQAITVATRLPVRLRRSGGWKDTALALPAGRWRDALTGAEYASEPCATNGGGTGNRGAASNSGGASNGGSAIPAAELTRHLPVALLELA